MSERGSQETEDEYRGRLMAEAMERDSFCVCGHKSYMHFGPTIDAENLMGVFQEPGSYGPFRCDGPDFKGCPEGCTSYIDSGDIEG